MEDPPKKKRKLIIYDIPGEELGTPAVPTPAAVVPPVIIPGPGPVHARVQQEVLLLCRNARCDEEDIDPYVWKRVDEILDVATREEAEVVAKRSLDIANTHFLLNKKNPEKQAKAAERIAKMWRTKGEDEKADKQLEKAKKIRDEMAQEVRDGNHRGP